MERHTVHQAVPSWRARPWTEACSRRSWLIAHRHARAVRSARGLARASCYSVNTPAAHIGSAQRQVRFPPDQLHRRPCSCLAATPARTRRSGNAGP